MPAKKVSPVLLPGKFSVSSTKQVQFTRGNLYYSSTDNAYHIEEEQNVTYATLGLTNYTSSHVCHFYWASTTDWQTSGKEPWASSYSYSTRTGVDEFFCGIKNPLTVDGQSGLYALTGSAEETTSEWYYLIKTRPDAVDLATYARVYTSAGMVDKCLVIAPDVCLNGYSFDKTKIEYTLEEWIEAKAAGLVCLPAAGIRNEYGNHDGSGSSGQYWSSSLHEYAQYKGYESYIPYACQITFNNGTVCYVKSSADRKTCQSVRLVSTVVSE